MELKSLGLKSLGLTRPGCHKDKLHFSKKHLPKAPIQLGLKILGFKCPATFTSQEWKEVESICALDFFKEFGFIRKKFFQWIICFLHPFQFTKYEIGFYLSALDFWHSLVWTWFLVYFKLQATAGRYVNPVQTRKKIQFIKLDILNYRIAKNECR